MKIISFFSFKGGVGRTALLTNLGAYWASQGRVVALIDLDLAAPGLSYSPLLGKYLDEKGFGLGISDVLDIYYDHGPDDEKVDTIRFLPPQYLLRDSKPSLGTLWHPYGRLLIIDAGSRIFRNPNPTLEENSNLLIEGVLKAIPRKVPFSEETEGELSLRALASYIREDLEGWRVPDGSAQGKAIDYLLIDSRTGFAELLDLSLGYLADTMVLVTGLNSQNLQGLQFSMQALMAEDRVPLDTFPALVTIVFSPIPTAEDKALFDALDAAHTIIRNSLRFTQSGQLEQAPPNFSIHYTPALATSDVLLAVEQPRSLYATEVRAIANYLAGPMRDVSIQEEVIKETRHDILQITEEPQLDTTPVSANKELSSPISAEDAAKIIEQRPHPLADLPPWYWPLSVEKQSTESRLKTLAILVTHNANLELDEETLATYLSWSISLNIKEKRKTLECLKKLTESQVNKLFQLLETERNKLTRAWLDLSKLDQRLHLLGRYIDAQREWAGFVLGNDDVGTERFLLASFEDGFAFPNWKSWPEYWIRLAKDLFVYLDDSEPGFNAINRAAQAAGNDNEKRQVTESLLELIEPGTIKSEIFEIFRQKVLDLTPNYTWLRFNLARHRLKLNEEEKDAAFTELEPLLVDLPEDGHKCWQLAALVLDYFPHYADRAKAAIEQSIRLEPEFAPAWKTLGDLFISEGLAQYDKVEEAYCKATEIDHRYAAPWNGLGNLYSHFLHRYQEAKKAYLKATDIEPKCVAAWIGLGNLYTQYLKQYNEAESAYLTATHIAPESAALWKELGYLYTRYLNRYERAEDAYLKAVKNEPKDAESQNGLGDLYSRYYYYYKAEEAYQRAIELDRNYAAPRDGLGNLYRDHLNRYEEAKIAYEEANEIDSNYAACLNDLGLLYQDGFQSFDEALGTFEEGLAIDPEDPYLLMNLGHLYLERDEKDKANEYLRRSLISFSKHKGFDSSMLRLAIELKETEQIETYLAEANKLLSRQEDLSKPYAFELTALLLLHALTNLDDQQTIIYYRNRALDSLNSYHDHFKLIKYLFLLASLRSETIRFISESDETANESDDVIDASKLVEELLNLPSFINSRFEDKPKPNQCLERYRAFADRRVDSAAEQITDPKGCSFLSYSRNRSQEAELLIEAQHELGIPTWPDLQGVDEGYTEREVVNILNDPKTANAILWLTPDMLESRFIRNIEAPIIIERNLRNDNFFTVPVAAGGSDYNKAIEIVNTVFSPRKISTASDWNILTVKQDPMNYDNAVVIAKRILEKRLRTIHQFLPSDEPLQIGFYTRVRAPSHEDTALSIDWSHCFNGREASYRDWVSRLLPAMKIIVGALHTYAHGCTVVAHGLCAIPAAVALGAAFLAPLGIKISWLQKRQGFPDQVWTLDAPRTPSGFAKDIQSEVVGADDLALLVSVASDVRPAFEASREIMPRFCAIVTVSKAGGVVHDLSEPGMAMDVARIVDEAVRSARKEYLFRGHVHLFIAGPVGLAVLIGQLVNTWGPVQTYEHIPSGGSGRYRPAALLLETSLTETAPVKPPGKAIPTKLRTPSAEIVAPPTGPFQAKQKANIAYDEFTIITITPIYGGGTKAGVPDETLPIRVAALRGQLRFWWRLINQRLPKNKLFEEERALWGGMSEKENDQSSKVRLRILNQTQLSKETCQRIQPCATQVGRAVRFLHDIPDYALFPARDKVATSYAPKIILPGLSFVLRAEFRSDNPCEAQEDPRYFP